MDNKTKEKIGQRINAALAERNVKQKELAKHLGIQDNTVSYWCKGERTPNTEQIINISELLNVSADYLLGLSSVPTTDKDIQFVCDYTGLSKKAIRALHDGIGNASPVDDDEEVKLIVSFGKIINHVLECPNFYTAIENYNSFLELWKPIVDRFYPKAKDDALTDFFDLGKELKEARMERFEAIDNLTHALTSYEGAYDAFLHKYNEIIAENFVFSKNVGDRNDNDTTA